MAQVKQEMGSQVEELKVKVSCACMRTLMIELLIKQACVYVQLYKVELERDQLHHASESMASRHKEELEAIQKSHEYVSHAILFITTSCS